MKVILLEDIKNVGKKGELINAADGYARNYLFPRKLAKPADAQSLNELKNAAEAKAFREKKEHDDAVALKAELEGKGVRISAKAGQNGKLFGAVTAKEIAAAIKESYGVEIDKRRIELEDIKSYGTFPVSIKLLSGITANMSVQVGE